MYWVSMTLFVDEHEVQGTSAGASSLDVRAARQGRVKTKACCAHEEGHASKSVGHDTTVQDAGEPLVHGEDTPSATPFSVSQRECGLVDRSLQVPRVQSPASLAPASRVPSSPAPPIVPISRLFARSATGFVPDA